MGIVDLYCHFDLVDKIFCSLTPAKPAPGTPAYKSREEYYDEVLALKKVSIICIVCHARNLTIYGTHFEEYSICSITQTRITQKLYIP